MQTDRPGQQFSAAGAYRGSRIEIARAALADCGTDLGVGRHERVIDGPGLATSGGLHEWFGGDDGARGTAWLPPMCVLIELAWRAIGSVGSGERVGEGAAAEPRRRVVWVGRRCWPYPPVLVRQGSAGRDAHGRDGLADRRLLDASVFVDPASREERVWALELAVRCAGVALVIGDGSGLAMAESRRLQLAAKDTAMLLARPGWETRALSAARTRWRVSPLSVCEIEGDHRQGWAVELLRSKGLRPETFGGARRWVVRRKHDEYRGTGRIGDRSLEWSAGDGGVAAAVGDGSDPASRTTRLSRIA